MCQNALGQSNCRSFKFLVHQEQKDELAWFFACWYKFIEIKIWLKYIRLGIVKNESGHSVPRTLILALSQQGI